MILVATNGINVDVSSVDLASLEELTPGQTIVVSIDGRSPYCSIILVNVKDSIRGYWNICQHVSIPLDGGVGRLPLVKGKLVCQTHGATYDPENGMCVHGPCKDEALEQIVIEIRDGRIIAQIENQD